MKKSSNKFKINQKPKNEEHLIQTYQYLENNIPEDQEPTNEKRNNKKQQKPNNNKQIIVNLHNSHQSLQIVK